MTKSQLSTFSALKETAFVFNEHSAQAKINLLKQCSLLLIPKSKQIEQYQSTLLFLMAYSENEIIYSLASAEMKRLSLFLKKMAKKDKPLLERTGLPYTQTQGAFSLTLVKWLLQNYTSQISLHSLEKTDTHPKEILKHALAEMEFDLAGNESLSPLLWLEKAFGTKDKHLLLKSLVQCIDAIKASPALKDQLFESLKLYVSISPKDTSLSKGFGNFPVQTPFYHHQNLLKRFDEQALIQKKLPAAKRLSAQEKTELIEKARIALLLLNRETDPITYCNTNGLQFYELEHGLSIALFSMLPERQLPIDSYIGFMMFKNGHPMAYGGAWLFAKRSLIGVNIFETFRGGESAFVFCQLLRTYRQLFDTLNFEVEPYQFGKNNPEGLKSGAFWFYYRFGFRPKDKDLHTLAETEFKKIQNIKGYRSSIETLKLFTHSNLLANFGEKKNSLDVACFSRYITQKINKQFGSDRNLAEKFCLSALKKDFGIDYTKANSAEKIGIVKLSFFVVLCIDTKKLNASITTKLKEMIFKKSLSEFTYILSTNAIPFEKIFFTDLLENLKLNK